MWPTLDAARASFTLLKVNKSVFLVKIQILPPSPMGLFYPGGEGYSSGIKGPCEIREEERCLDDMECKSRLFTQATSYI